jgi:hypothetical protein
MEISLLKWRNVCLAAKGKKKMFLDLMKILEDSGDVKFQIGREEFPAHLNILQVRAPEVAALAKDYPPDTHIPIQDIQPSPSRSLLHFVYTDDVPIPEELGNEARCGRSL